MANLERMHLFYLSAPADTKGTNRILSPASPLGSSRKKCRTDRVPMGKPERVISISPHVFCALLDVVTILSWETVAKTTPHYRGGSLALAEILYMEGLGCAVQKIMTKFRIHRGWLGLVVMRLIWCFSYLSRSSSAMLKFKKKKT